MKVGYPDTINSGNSSASPFKMVDASKADLDKDGKVSEYEGNRADAAFGDTPINMTGPLYAKDRKKSKTRAELNALRLKNARKKKLNSNTPRGSLKLVWQRIEEIFQNILKELKNYHKDQKLIKL